MSNATDVVILGGGVIGCSLAYQLARRGVSVVVLESGEIGAQASSAATGLLAPFKLLGKADDAYLALQRASLALFPRLARELEELTGLSIDYQQTGCIRLASMSQSVRLQEWVAAWCSRGVTMTVLQGDKLAQQVPALAESYQIAVSIPSEPQVQAVSYMRAIARAAELSGARLASGCQIVGVDRDGSRVIAVRAAGGDRFACGSLILATGAWSGQVGNTLLGLQLPVAPAGGQSLELRQPRQPLHHILFGEGIYLAPKSDGRLYVGATHEEMGFVPRVTSEGTAWLLDAVRRLIPGLIGCVVERAWAGLRPATPDRRPILGLAPSWSNVALACGHNGFGVLLSAITGQAIADLVTGGSVPEVARPFALARFDSPAANVA
jgi:glycine oxidase